MEKLIVKTSSLIDKARKLVEQNTKLRQQNTDLANEVKKLQLELEAEQVKIGELNNKIKIIKLAHSISEGTEAGNAEIPELKRKINEYIREIDNCIAMLNE
jgi:phage shock protein A